MDIILEGHESGDTLDEIIQHLDELENVLLDGGREGDGSTLNKRWGNFKRLKNKLTDAIVKLKNELDEERKRRKKEEEKVLCFEKALAVERSVFQGVKRENERMVDKINYMKRKQKSCEMENEDLLHSMEIIKGRVARERGDDTVQEQRMTKERTELEYYKREMVRSRIIIQFGAKGMDMLKRNLELCVREIHHQREENELIKQELIKYKKNYSDQGRNYDFMMQDLQNLESFLRPQYKTCFRKNGKTALEINIIQRIKELLTEAYCRSLIT